MDRRNGGDHQAPPRPPKLLPRIHRPRAPDPMEVLNELPLNQNTDRREEIGIGFGTNTPRCTNRHHHPHHQQQQQQHFNASDVTKSPVEISEQIQQREQLNSITTATTTIRTTSTSTQPSISSTSLSTLITAPPKTSSSINENPLAFINSEATSHPNTNTNVGANSNDDLSNSYTTIKNNININNKNDNVKSTPGTFVINNNLLSDTNLLATCPDYENYQIYHLTYLPQRPSSLSVGSLPPTLSSSSSITAANSFTRRRPQQGSPGTTADTPSWRMSGNNSSFGSFFSHFQNQNADNTTASTSPVTLAQPRPESQRLTNEYVDTPLRTIHLLQNATRSQHPAGQQDNNQTTTHHVLLLPQRELHQSRSAATQIPNTIVDTTNTSTASTNFVTTPTTTISATNLGIDGTDGTGFLHSQNQKSQAFTLLQLQSTQNVIQQTQRDSNSTIAIHNQQQRLRQQQHQHNQLLPPITKQPQSAPTKCKSSLIGDTSSIPIASNASSNNGPIGTPIIIAGSLGSMNSITCPRCGLCRCEQCKSSGLPQKWLCKKSCLCSAESVMDYATCLCCAKAIFYHCATQGDMDDEEDYIDDPCSCTPRKRLQRWGWLSALSLILPCLWCYWPMRGCTWLCEKCYNSFAGRGCRCQQNTTSNMLPIMPLTNHGNNADANSNIHDTNSTNHQSKSSSHHHYHHHHHHHGDSMASRMLRKGDITPEKRLLDTNMDY